MRGNHRWQTIHCANVRSIPAYAGEPSVPVQPAPVFEVYPRVCGGTGEHPAGAYAALGLSPRMRGNRCWRRKSLCVARSIPAYAGEPRFVIVDPAYAEVYPRVCGGTRCQPAASSTSQGLSPRMRGNPTPAPPAAPRARSIPAYAGEPGQIIGLASRWKVYPRVCGGTAARKSHNISTKGLSPRMRGNLGSEFRMEIMARSIPAYAGEPRAGHPALGQSEVYPRVCGGTGLE